MRVWINAGIAVLLCALALPAAADPPAHAPAHGWRKQHDPNYVGYTGKTWERDYGVLEGRCNREEVGAVVGGMIGAAIGSQVGDGSGRVVAIVAGTIIGATIGREVGEDLDEADRACLGHALELGRDGSAVAWTKPGVGSYQVIPTGATSARGDTCRAFRLVSTAGGKRQDGCGEACRTADGIWRLVPTTASAAVK